MSKLYSILLVLIASALATTVHAQVLEEIVVTAQKREQSIQDVGIAITAMTGDQMEALGLDNAQQITAQVPGATTIQPKRTVCLFHQHSRCRSERLFRRSSRIPSRGIS